MIRTCIHACLATLLALFAAASSAQNEPDQASRYQHLFKELATAVEAPEDLAPLYSAIGDRRAVLLGESTHGTQEYYQWRATISQHLIENKGFRFIGVEGDWASIYQLNRYIKGLTPDDQSARDVMRREITRWPQWMWANEEFAEFVEWLRKYNSEREAGDKVGLYGLDMQDPEGSMAQVLAWFEQNDEERHARVADAYRQFTRFPETFRGYAQHLMRGGERLEDVARLPVELLREAMGDDPGDADKAQWAALQNALAVKRAEAQFHGAASRGPESWNARARYMHEAYLRIAERHGEGSKGIVWAHNTHVGDARATDMRNRGEVNIGQLMRESEGEDNVFILGFSTHRGTVIAGAEWGNERQTMTVVPAHPESVDAALHKAGLDQHLLLFGPETREDNWLIPMHKRAIGVIYRPPNEAYVPTLISLRYDALLYIDKTHALTPLSD